MKLPRILCEKWSLSNINLHILQTTAIQSLDKHAINSPENLRVHTTDKLKDKLRYKR